MYLTCPSCQLRFQVACLKQHCFERHGYAEKMWQHFLRRQHSQTLVNLLENRNEHVSDSKKGRDGSKIVLGQVVAAVHVAGQEPQPSVSGFPSALPSGWLPPPGARLYDESRVRPVLQCGRCEKIIRNPHHRCKPGDVARADKRKMSDPDLTGVEIGSSMESSHRRH